MAARARSFCFSVARRVAAVVELTEGPHVLTNLTNMPPEDVKIGMQVEVTFTVLADGSKLPLFQAPRAPS